MELFDFNTIDNFDNHINLSIPNYEQLFDLYVSLTSIFSEEGTSVIDYGCSTGKLLKAIPKKKGVHYIGIDNSDLLPESHDGIDFIKEDALQVMPSSASVVISMFFLQFLSKIKRQIMLQKLKEHVDAGSILLISEKVILDDSRLDNLLSRLHIHKKRGQFSDTEILTKDKQLICTMFCKTEQELLRELQSIGKVTKVWQSFTFMGFIVKSNYES
jgi:tRNA (cmo5U34)-methyltransferase